MDEIVDDVGRRYSPWIRWLDRLGGEDDEILSGYGIRVGRGMARYNAQRLLAPETDDEAVRSLNRSTLAFGKRLLEPPPLVTRRVRAAVAASAHLPLPPLAAGSGAT